MPRPDFYFSVADPSVRHDYAEILLALVVDYTSKFMRFYFQPRIEVVPVGGTGGGSFRLANRTMLPFVASPNAIAIAYDDENGLRRVVEVTCSGATDLTLPPLADSSDRIGPLSDLVCSMPDTL